MKTVQLPPEREISPARLAQLREHLVDEIAQPHLEPRPRPSRRRRRLVVLVVVPALVALGTAFAYLLRPAEDIVNGIGCFDAPRTESNTAVVNADGRHPVEICAEIWESGDMGPYPFTPRPAPPLKACVPPRADVVWVFPGQGPGFCASLGLGDLPAGFEEASAKFAGMRDELGQRLDSRCVEEAEAREIAREVLDRHGFTDWSVEEGSGFAGEGFSEARPCAELAFDAAAKVVTLVPGERLLS